MITSGLLRIGRVTFNHLDMALLYEPKETVASIKYVFYRSVGRTATGFQAMLFYKVAKNVKNFFSSYYTNLFRQILV